MSNSAARQRQWAKFHLVFASVRFAAWTALAGIFLVHEYVAPHAPLFAFTGHLFRSVAFVAFISLYANALTDLTVAMAAYAGLISADSRMDVQDASSALLRQILATTEAIEDRLEQQERD